jgi:uncharacterized OB-fold protein
MSAPLPLREGLFSRSDPPGLLASRCVVCARHHFPRAEICPYCGAEGSAPVELKGPGRLWAWTAVRSAPPGYSGDVPYGFGVVELPEGLRVVTRLTEPDPAVLRAGQVMHLTLVELPGPDGVGVLSYAFAREAGP